MRRRSKAGGETVNPRRPTAVTLKRGNATKSVRSRRSSAANRQKKVALLASELDEARQQQAATADVLKVMSRSTFDLQSVLDILAESAARLCEADLANIWRPHGSVYRLAAAHQPFKSSAKDYLKNFSIEPSRGTCVGRTLLESRIVHIHDILDDLDYALATSRLEGVRTMLGIPLLREGTPIGVIALARSTCRPFTAQQIELATTFATQAVIAIENTRLLNELRQRTDDLTELLEQQTATSEVLQVISSSPGELEPVFQSMLANALRICEANFGTLFRFDGKAFHSAAEVGASPEYVEFQRQRGAFQPGPGTQLERMMRTRQVSHTADDAASAVPGAGARLGGARSLVWVPMLKEDVLAGAIGIWRREVRPFTDKQIALVQNFAAQAVIAIENTRLLGELRQRTTDLTESLEQQTAISEILRVISNSPSDVQPVLDLVAEHAARICQAQIVDIAVVENDAFHIGASFGEFGRMPRGELIPLNRSTLMGRSIVDRLPLQDEDQQKAGADFALGRELAVKYGHRTILSVPLVREGRALGAIIVRRIEVRPFVQSDIALLTTFADQVAIAIENVRLFNAERQRTRELSESLEQQTATSEVLRVISSSPGELEPVFQAMLENATRICEAKFGQLLRFRGDGFEFVAGVDLPPSYAEFMRGRGRFSPPAGSQLDRAMATKRVSYTADMAADSVPGSPATFGGARSSVAVPMLKDDNLIGAIVIYRQEVRPFTEKQIELLTNFAAQAVIAIENTRLLNELRESLQQQTATADVLSTISSSRGELDPVFQAMLENGTRICEAKFGVLSLNEGDALRVVAMHNAPPTYVELRRREPTFKPTGNLGALVARAVATKRAVQTADIADTLAGNEDPQARNFAAVTGARTIIIVPMLKDNEPVGVITIYRQDVRPFADKQIELLTNFAAQAVIAIENARLLNELRRRTADLTESLENLRSAQDRLVQTEKLASLGQLTAGIAHEIKNPLNFVNNFSGLSVELIEELEEGLKSVTLDDKRRAEFGELTETLRGNLQKVVQHGQRADAIVKNMLLHSRQGSGEHRPVDVNALVEESLNLAYHGARAEKQGFNITLEQSFDPTAGEVNLFPQEITRVLLNLISNGFYAATKRKAETNGGDYEPTLTAATKNLGDSVEIRIRDNGTGIPDEVKEKMFNPFFTTKPAGEGTGLGLSISHDIIVKQHGGSIEVDTQPGEFTEFRIVLPRTGIKSGERA